MTSTSATDQPDYQYEPRGLDRCEEILKSELTSVHQDVQFARAVHAHCQGELDVSRSAGAGYERHSKRRFAVAVIPGVDMGD